MEIVILHNTTSDRLVCARCLVADNFWTRGRGLLGRDGLEEDEGILLVPGTSIHMWGMKFAIDVAFLTREGVVTDLAPQLGPGRWWRARAHAGKPWCALEVSAGTIERTALRIGDRIERRAVEGTAQARQTGARRRDDQMGSGHA